MWNIISYSWIITEKILNETLLNILILKGTYDVTDRRKIVEGFEVKLFQMLENSFKKVCGLKTYRGQCDLEYSSSWLLWLILV